MTDREKAQKARRDQEDKLKEALEQVTEVQDVARRARAQLTRDSFIRDIELAMARRA